jgi:hypothetical protein
MVHHAQGMPRTMMETTMTETMILAAQNRQGGFWRAMGEQAATAWPIAFEAIALSTGAEADDVRGFLDSRLGRGFAAEVLDHQRQGLCLAQAIAEATKDAMVVQILDRGCPITGRPRMGVPALLLAIEKAAAVIDIDDGRGPTSF